jgi:hypothetical protein
VTGFHASVARIHVGVGGADRVTGAGFLVAPDLVVT